MLQKENRGVSLGRSDPDPVEVVNPSGRSAVFLVCEHAGRIIPSALEGLGLAPEEMGRHIAWDIGAEGLARRLSDTLDATLFLQRYSRLVVDCNRPLEARDCIPEISDGTAIQANCDLTHAERTRRFEEIHRPFHDAIAASLDRRKEQNRLTVLTTIHSFAPRFANLDRPWQLGVCFNRDAVFAEVFMRAFQSANPAIIAAFNEPYTVDDTCDYAIPVHGERRGLPHVLLEIRNDQLLDVEGQEHWARLISNTLRTALKSLSKERQHGA